MLAEKLSLSSRQVIFTAKKKAEKETLGLPTFAHLLSSFASQKEDLTAKVWQSIDLKIDRALLYQTAPLDEILKESVNEANLASSETVETSHLLVSTLKVLHISDTVLMEIRHRLFLDRPLTEGTRKKTLLETYTHDLSAELRPVFERAEVKEAAKILMRKEKNSLCLTGDKGVGKTSLVLSLSRMFAGSPSSSQFGLTMAPTSLGYGPQRILRFNTNTFMLSDLPNPDDTFLNFLNEAVKDRSVILFFDDFNIFFAPSLTFHSIVPTLKSYIEMHGLRVIVAYNTSEFSRIFEQDEFFSNFFTVLNIEPSSPTDALKILRLKKDEFSQFHGIKIEESVLPAVVRLSEFVNTEPLPEKAVDLLDLACVEAKANVGKGKTDVILDLEDLNKVASNLSGIPLNTVAGDERKSLLGLEKTLSSEIIGQDEAVSSLSRALRKARLGLSEATKPLSSFLFLGPTGVGKTELVKVLARSLFGRDYRNDHLIKIDMSEFKERHTVSRLIGAPPGYVGFGQGGELTEKVLRNPYSVILVDEMEKAAPEVLSIFLQVLDDGVLTDGEGNPVDFKHTVVVFTSNVGAELVKKGSLGFEMSNQDEKGKDVKTGSHEDLRQKLLGELKNNFRPEFLNRLDSIIVFRKLNLSDVQKICRVQVNKVGKRFGEKGVELSFDNSAINFLAKKGFSDEYGARNLKRTIEEKVVDTLAGYLLSGRLSDGDKVRVFANEKRLIFKINNS